MAVIAMFSSIALAQTASNTDHSAKKVSADDCNLKFRGDGRKAVKLRTLGDGSSYAKLNDGKPVSVQEWYSITCSLDFKVPARVPAAKPMQGIETQIVTLEGYLVAAKFDPDRDIHAEIGASPKWTRPLVVVEVPPGENYCAARKALWGLVGKELPPNSTDHFHVMENPPKIRVTGYVFLDATPGKTTPYPCRTGVKRGMKPRGKQAQVQGLWEVHPVLDVVGE